VNKETSVPSTDRPTATDRVGRLVETFLPGEDPAVTLMCPTRNRWGTPEAPGVVNGLLESLECLLVKEDLTGEARILLADASPPDEVAGPRLRGLARAFVNRRSTPVYLLTPERQRWVAEQVVARTGLAPEIVDALLVHPGYAGQRTKLDAVAGGRVVTFDDDCRMPEAYPVLRAGALAGVPLLPNSQIMIRGKQIPPELVDLRPNRIRPLWEHLGRPIGEVRRSWPGLRVTEYLRETMHAALEQTKLGVAHTQSVMTHDDAEDLPGSDDARVMASWAIKYGDPDFRTIFIARSNIEHEFPPYELPIQSCLSGPPEPFAHQKSRTGVDSAVLARILDGESAWIPWWFVTREAISLRNPLGTVTGQYRSENDLLGSILGTVSGGGRSPQVYLAATTQAFHERTRTGYRQDLPEQSTAALVGGLAASEANRHLRVDPVRGRAWLERPEEGYSLPRERAQVTFEEIMSLVHLCRGKLQALSQPGATSSNAALTVEQLRGRYGELLELLLRKTGGGDLDTFLRAASVEIRDQLRFYADVLDARPAVLEAVRELILAERYPVLRYAPP
jgi:hypothetical protein